MKQWWCWEKAPPRRLNIACMVDLHMKSFRNVTNAWYVDCGMGLNGAVPAMAAAIGFFPALRCLLRSHTTDTHAKWLPWIREKNLPNRTLFIIWKRRKKCSRKIAHEEWNSMRQRHERVLSLSLSPHYYSLSLSPSFPVMFDEACLKHSTNFGIFLHKYMALMMIISFFQFDSARHFFFHSSSFLYLSLFRHLERCLISFRFLLANYTRCSKFSAESIPLACAPQVLSVSMFIPEIENHPQWRHFRWGLLLVCYQLQSFIPVYACTPHTIQRYLVHTTIPGIRTA